MLSSRFHISWPVTNTKSTRKKHLHKGIIFKELQDWLNIWTLFPIPEYFGAKFIKIIGNLQKRNYVCVCVTQLHLCTYYLGWISLIILASVIMLPSYGPNVEPLGKLTRAKTPFSSEHSFDISRLSCSGNVCTAWSDTVPSLGTGLSENGAGTNTDRWY